MSFLIGVLFVGIFAMLIGAFLVANDSLAISTERSPIGGLAFLIGLAVIIGAILDMVF